MKPFLILLSLFISTALQPSGQTDAAEHHAGEVRDLSPILTPLLKRHGIPALAAAALRGDELTALGAVGVRQADKDVAVTVDDLFHLGSNTKAMTATLAGVLVEEGLLSWDSTVRDIFPDFTGEVRAEYHTVTLRQLLTHHSGVPGQPDPEVWAQAWRLAGPMREQRKELARLTLNQSPIALPGERYQYSNLGYVVAGAMLEAVTDQAWEELLREKIAAPLGMESLGYGPPGSPDSRDQPWGHRAGEESLIPVPPGRMADNPPVLGPAGTVHCTMKDWAKFASLHLRGARGDAGLLLKPETFEVLHGVSGPPSGWISADRTWAGGTALNHAGSNTMWYALIWLAPEKKVGYLSAANAGSQAAFTACDEAVAAMIQLTAP